VKRASTSRTRIRGVVPSIVVVAVAEEAGLTTRVDAMVAAVTAVAGLAARDKPITLHTPRISARLAARASVQMHRVTTPAPSRARRANAAVGIVTAVIRMAAIAVASVTDRAAAMAAARAVDTAVAAKVVDTAVVRVTPATEVVAVIPVTEVVADSRAVRVPAVVAMAAATRVAEMVAAASRG